jgi:hypothetical protein
MNTFPTVQAAPDGLYWYMVPGQAPEPVLVNRARYGERFKAFNGREQSWLRDGETLTGPVHPPSPARRLQADEGMALMEAIGAVPQPLNRKVNTGA